MKHERAATPDLTPLATSVARARLLLCELLLWFSEILGDWWRDPEWRAGMLEELQHLRRAQAMLVFMAADARRTPAAAAHAPAHRPPNAPPGFSRARWSHRRRRVWRIAPAGRGLRGRIEALRDANAQFETHVARMLALIARPTRVAAYIMTRAPAEACIALARVEESAIDTS